MTAKGGATRRVHYSTPLRFWGEWWKPVHPFFPPTGHGFQLLVLTNTIASRMARDGIRTIAGPCGTRGSVRDKGDRHWAGRDAPACL